MDKIYQLEPIVETLTAGGLILYPTDTIWGIGCDATRADSIDRVYALKRRDPSKPLAILVADIAMLKEYVPVVHPRVETLLAYHARPLTIVFDQSRGLPPNLTGPGGSIAVRIPQDDFCVRLIRAFGKPVVSTSANVSGEPFPRHFGEISSQIIQGVDYVVKYRQKDKQMGEPSVIARISDPERAELIFLRN